MRAIDAYYKGHIIRRGSRKLEYNISVDGRVNRESWL